MLSGYVAFVKKEFMENSRTFKLLILFSVFFIFGMMGPLTAKLTPEIIKTFATDEITFTLPEPSAVDSYIQFFKNVGQMGLLVLVLIFGGTLTNEYTKGTLINVLTKGLSRRTIIFAKFTAASILWTLTMLISIVTTFGYTKYLFPEDTVYHLIPAVACLWLFGVFLLAVIIFASTLVNSNYSCLLIVAIIVAALFMINIIPPVRSYNPSLLASQNVAMLAENYDLKDCLKSVVVTLTSIAGLLIASVTLFDKKRI